MTATTTMVACTSCRLVWYQGSEKPACSDPSHTHQQFELHRHLTVVCLPDGTEVTAVSFDPGDPYSRGRLPDYGLYFDRRWRPPWPHELVDWPDGGVPSEPAGFVSTLTSLLSRARAGDNVEVGCLGAHGRTGTALACLAVMCGCPAADAVTWVRGNYCPSAVESPEQQSFVLAFQI